jgi:hypothetical protein
MRLSSIFGLSLVTLAIAACGGEPPPNTPPPPPADTPPPAPPPAAPEPPKAPEPPPKAEAPPPPPPAEPPPPPADDKKKLPGANLTMGSLKADGVELKDISCKMEGALGLLGAIALGAGFSAKKTALDACSKGKVSETTVTWTAAGGKMSGVKAEGPDAKVNKCVEKALTGAKAPLPAVCMGTLVHGK